MIASISAALVNIVTNYILIPVFGYMAAAYTTLVSYIILAFVQAYFARRVHKEITGENRVYADYFVMLLGIITVILTLTGLFFYKTFILRYIVIVIGGILACWIGYKSFYHMKK